MFLYKCHPKHAFSTDKEKAIPISRRDTAGTSKYWIRPSSTDWDRIQIKLSMKIKNLLNKLDKIYKSHNYTEKENNFGKKLRRKM